MTSLPDNRSIGELLSELSKETATLVQQEVALARSELRRAVARLSRHAAVIAGGGALAYAGLLTLVAAVVLGLAAWGLTPWIAAAITGAAVLAIGYFMVQHGLAALRRDQVVPAATVETMKENVQWAKNQLK